MKISIVPDIINTDFIKITDDNFVLINLCDKSNSRLDPNIFQNPYIIINSYDSTKYKEVEIKRIQLPQIEKLGYRLVSMSLNSSRKNMKNYREQKVSYMIKKKTDPLEGSTEMFKVPTDHFLEIDIINKRIRIRGKNSYPYLRVENASRWIEIKEE